MNDAALETPRLTLRPLVEDDFAFFAALHTDDRVCRHLGDGRPWTEQKARDWLAKVMAWHRDEGLGQHGIVRTADGKLIGRTGLSAFEVETEGEKPQAFWGRGSAPAGAKTTQILELGYTLHPDAWGQGFATEASQAMRDYAFGTIGADRLMSLIREDNQPSIRVAVRNGFVNVGTLHFADLPALRYELSRSDWAALRTR